MASKAVLKEKKNKGGRPRIELTDTQLKELKILAPICTIDEIADYFGIAKDTFRQIKIRDEEVFSIYKKGRVQAKGIMGGALFRRGVAGDTTAAIFYMKTQGGWSSANDSLGRDDQSTIDRLQEDPIVAKARARILEKNAEDMKREIEELRKIEELKLEKNV